VPVTFTSFELTGSTTLRATDPVHAPPRAGEVRDSWCDIGAAREVLGYEPGVAFDEGLRRTIDWIAREGTADLR
jgi:nucleoside-diphosphate-sugar epimerase